jgi:hypothetical protein
MSVSAAFGSLPSAEPPAEQENVRVEQAPPQTFPPSGNDATGEDSPVQSASTPAPRGQDEVKLQWQPPGETAVYQFVNQQGTLILQVPSEQELNLSRQISQELAQEAAPKAAAVVGEGGKDHGR